MNRINRLFEERKNKVLSVYFTAGYPEVDDTLKIVKLLDAEGVDMIEIGMPFSDPLADGPVIQKSSQKALQNGMSLKVLFQQLENIREITDVPLILMGYINPVLQYGVPDFISDCSRTGIDGLIIPDLPLDFYLYNYEDLFEHFGIRNISLITPQTSEERVRFIDSVSNGFIYMVSSSTTTGGNSGISEEQNNYFSRIKSYELDNPCLIGFGISDKNSFDHASKYARGAIIGSAFIKAIKDGNLEKSVPAFMRSVLG
jgi:tryptophan synthase alpha chain